MIHTHGCNAFVHFFTRLESQPGSWTHLEPSRPKLWCIPLAWLANVQSGLPCPATMNTVRPQTWPNFGTPNPTWAFWGGTLVVLSPSGCQMACPSQVPFDELGIWLNFWCLPCFWLLHGSVSLAAWLRALLEQQWQQADFGLEQFFTMENT